MFSGGVKKQHRAVMTALKALIFLVLQIDVKNSVKKMQWSSSVTRVYFSMESQTFGKVAFRGAYKAKSEDRQFHNKQWEIKRYMFHRMTFYKCKILSSSIHKSKPKHANWLRKLQQICKMQRMIKLALERQKGKL